MRNNAIGVNGVHFNFNLPVVFMMTCSSIVPFLSFSQNVGIGTATPLEKLHVIGNIRSSTLAGAGNRLVLSDLNGTLVNATGVTSPAWMTLGNTGLVNGTNFLGTTDNVDVRIRTLNVERITIKGSGSIGLFTNAPVSSWLHSIPPSLVTDFQFKWDNNLNGDAPARFQNSVTANGNRVFLGSTNYNGTAFAATAVMGLALDGTNTAPTLAGAEGVRGFSNSNAGIGVRAGFTGGTLPAAIGWALYAGGWAGGTSPWLTVSDESLKKDVTTIDNALNKVMQIRGVEYSFNTDKYPKLRLSNERQTGFIAQEIESIFPSMVHNKGIPAEEGVQNNGMSENRESYQLKAVSYTDLIPVLVEAIKEQQAKIEKLESEIAKLKKTE